MFNFIFRQVRWIKKIPIAQRVFQFWMHRYAEGSVATLKYGLAKGMRWKRSHRQPNSFWLGYYEIENQVALQKYLKPGNVFYDLGANGGFFSVVAAKFVGDQGFCLALEPDPTNFESINEQFKLNSLNQCVALACAVSSQEGQAQFFFSEPGSAVGHLGQRGDYSDRAVDVELTTLDILIKKYRHPDFIKMDIEGAEVLALQGASTLLKEVRPAWLIELHGPECNRGVKEIMVAANYHLTDLEGRALNLETELPFQILALPRHL